MNFYNDLESLAMPVKDVMQDEKNFVPLPAGWYVIIADISNSTEAVRLGRHTDVNLIAAGSLVAVLNVSREAGIEIPFFWGGDGGTVIVPSELLEKAMAGLQAYKNNSRKHFALDLRIGAVSVEEIINTGHELKLAKVAVGSGFNKSIVIGDGLKYAEQKIKKGFPLLQQQEDRAEGLLPLNMEGLECRWDTIAPPRKGREVVCLLIEAIDPKNQFTVYRNALQKLEEIYGKPDKRNPLSIQRLKLKNSFKKFQDEMKAKYSSRRPFYIAGLFFKTLIGKIYFRYNLKFNNLKGNDYLAQVVEYADTLTIDGRINSIVSGTLENRKAFLAYLSEEEQRGTLVYGHHVSAESMMTCYVQNLHNKHIHFVDGVNGGYTEAARELKPKFSKV